ncbi:Sec23-binding domain of Sec16-domain-containing protein [Multifurca ochricompacta]|uniref:Protein transport protein sec16 n=1 Tax=Multifurca ochricompacta TaxID=376703 RepID=A0AAD4MAH8_9AGAM|nr:Sec23-binding domain of Sec16-domain-containing protein [Multifurca ochricompacta]
MEEAASLFGPADTTSDPFGSIVAHGGDDLTESTTLLSNEPPPLGERELNPGSDWLSVPSSHHQAHDSLHPEYDWRSGDNDSSGHPNSQSHYGVSTPRGLTNRQQWNSRGSENSQYMASYDVDDAHQVQQQYEPSIEQASLERPLVLQSSNGLLDDDPSSALHARDAHAQPVSDPYRPGAYLPSNGGDPHVYSKPSVSSPLDHTTAYSAYQPVTNNGLSVLQSGYQPYSAPSSSLPPQTVHTSIGSKDSTLDPSRVAALYRPKTSNAYDPPIPPPKPSRHFSGASGSSRMLSPVGATQAYTAQEARHVGYNSNAGSLPSVDRFTSQAHVPPLLPAMHPPSTAHLVNEVSPPQRVPHSRIVPGSSSHSGHFVGRSPYSISPESESLHSRRNTFDRGYPHGVPSINSVSENLLTNRPGYPVAVSRENETYPLRQVEGPYGVTERGHGADIPMSTNQHDYPETEGGFIHHRTTNSSDSLEASRSPPVPMLPASQELSSYTSALERTQSPGSSSVRSIQSLRSRDLVSPPPSDLAAGFASDVPVSDEPVFAGTSTESRPVTSRVSSPASIRSWKSPYVPRAAAMTTRDRSTSESSLLSSHSSVASDPYAPSRRSQNPPEASLSASLHQSSRMPLHDTDRSHGQTLVFPVQTHAPYAPSPSLLGSNDPLGRTSSRASVVSFGFGGKLVLCFHGSNTLNTGFDIALSSRQTTGIQMRPLHAVIPESALDHISTSFPGPLFGDPGSPTGLVRAAAATQSKNNKAKAIKYIEERAEEIFRGLGYLSPRSPERRQAEGKHVLVKLLKVLLEHDGHLSGSPQVEASVRAILVPRIGDASTLEQSTTSPKMSLYGIDGAAVPSLGLSTFDTHDRVLSVQTVRSSALDKIQEHLARGERRAAYHYALDERLWAHAMIIASSIDRESWKEVVNEFIRTELSSQIVTDAPGSIHRDTTSIGTGREPLKVAYSLYSGQGAASIQALVPLMPLSKSGEMLQIPPVSHVTPISPSFPSHATTVPVPEDVLDRWPDTAAMLIPGPSISECSAALLALGDCLLANHWAEAAHACYLLAPQSAVLGTIGSPGRVTLIGSRGPANFHVSDDAIVLSEIVEFALSLASPSKSQDPFNGLPHLQAYKLVRAASLAEMGYIVAATRYCEAITTCLGRVHTVSHPELSEQLKELSDRLVGAPHLDKTGSWISGKMARPSLDSFGNWLGGRLTELVAGGDESPTANGDTTPHENKAFAGPFSHYSTISSSTTSKASSPQPTIVNHNVLADVESKFPRRTGSAQAIRLNPQVQIDRASSAMEYRPTHRNSSPAPRIASANAATTHFSRVGLNHSGYPQANTTYSVYQRPEDELSSPDLNTGTWWGSSSAEDSTTATPTVTTFPNDRPSPQSGFVSLMDAPPMPAIPASAFVIHDDDGDLGLGNSSGKRKAQSNDSGTSDNSVPDTKTVQAIARSQSESKPSQQSSSWFGRWWNREGSSGPVKATLGEESSFVYDKELKRWVNKKADAKTPHPAVPPPPPRAQTTSPGHPTLRISNGTSLPPPPARVASAIDLTASPPKRAVPRPRSTLALTGEETTNNVPSPSSRTTDSPPPGPSGSPTPPPSRPRSQAAKRNLRSRYVDVFQQPTVES